MNWARYFRDLSLKASAAVVLYLGVVSVGPWVETTYFPVYSSFEIVSIEASGDHQSRAVFKFTKYRECESAGFAWFQGELNTPLRPLEVRVVRDPGDPVTVRPLGEQLSSPYLLDVTLDRIENVTFAEVFSRCHPFWLTRSIIYP